jgi:two-component system phosphate regulon response regulator PhoB
LRILIADDHEELRLMVRRALLKGGHEVLEAASGTDALALIQREKPDLVLLDLKMPPPGGLAVLQSLRARAETRSLPVVVLTGEGNEESARMCFELGATDYLAKPFSLPQLDARIRSCIARAAQR